MIDIEASVLIGLTLAPLVSALTALALLAALLRYRSAPLDRPNARSLHSAPIPRVGGLAVMPAIAAGWSLIPTAVPWIVWLPAAGLFFVSLLDDVRNLPVGARLSTHLGAASCVAAFWVLPHAGWIGMLAATLAIAWVTNLYNFMDGSDGLAGGMALFGFGGYAIIAWMGNDYSLAFACLCVCAASAVFLWFNFHPARIFLGDAGSIPIGFLAAALGAQGWAAGTWPAWIPLLLFSPFIADATITLGRRAMRGERVWEAHRQHYYQRLVRCGWGHRTTALMEYMLMACCVLLGAMGMYQPAHAQTLLLVGTAVLYWILMTLIDRAWRKQSESE